MSALARADSPRFCRSGFGRTVLLTQSLSEVVSVLVLLLFGFVGAPVLRRSRLSLTDLECVVYGFPLGIVVVSLVLLGIAVWSGHLSALHVIAVAGISAIAGAVLLRGRSSRMHFPARRSGLTRSDRWLIVAFVLVVAYQAYFWFNVIRFENGMLISRQGNIYGDWGMHLGDISSFLWSENVPPSHPRLIDTPMSYHYLTSFTAAAVASLGIEPVFVMAAQSFLLMVFIIGGLFAFGLRVTSERFSAALFVPLFLLGGGLGWAPLLARLPYSAEDPLRVFHDQVFARELLRGRNYQLPNSEYVIQAQRGFLYGLPLALLVLSLLLVAIRTIHDRAVAPSPSPLPVRVAKSVPSSNRSLRPFIAAGLIAGVIPIGHFSTVYALVLSVPAIALLSLVPWTARSSRYRSDQLVPLIRGWALFGAVWAALTIPQVLWVYGGDLGTGDSLRVKWGWLAGSDPWWFFWVKNIGMYAIVFPLAVALRDSLDQVTQRFLLGFTAIFILGNVYAFLPWSWNNALFFQYWMMSAALFAAALIGRGWMRRRRDPLAHFALALTVLTLIGLGLLVHLNFFTTNDRWTLATADGVALSKQIRDETPADAVFVTGTYYSNPVAVLTGRQLVVGYPFYLTTQGLDWTEQERDVRLIMTMSDEAPALLARYDVDYVVIGNWERKHFAANVQQFSETYPIAISVGEWNVFAVSPRAKLAIREQRLGWIGAPANREEQRGNPVQPFPMDSSGVRRIGAGHA